MAKKLINLTIEELRDEMSISGSPEKIAGHIQKAYEQFNEVDTKNVSEIQNLGLGLRWIIARLNHHIKYMEGQTGQSYERI